MFSQLPDSGLRSVIDQERAKRDVVVSTAHSPQKKKTTTWRAIALSLVRTIDRL
jgi:hypothetical protein